MAVSAVLKRTCALALILAMAACGGGGGGSGEGSAGGENTPAPDAPVAAVTLSGTAAVGAPLAGATVTLKDANGTTRVVTADAAGRFDGGSVATLVAPVMLQAVGTAGGVPFTVHSVLASLPAAGDVVANVTPATEAITAQAVAGEPALAFADAARIRAITAENVNQAKARVTAAVSQVLSALQQGAATDLVSTAFDANGTGLDKMLDLVSFSVQVGTTGVDIVITDQGTGTGIVVPQTATVETVSQLPAPNAGVLALDTASIATLVSSFNELMATSAGAASSQMVDLYTADYLEDGQNRAAEVQAQAEFIGSRLTSHLVRGCEVDVCRVIVAFADADGSTGWDPVYVKLGADGKWRFHGNRRSFEFGITTVATPEFTVDRGTVSQTSLDYGINLNIQPPFGSATLEVSLDGGSTWGTPVKLQAQSGCAYLAVVNVNNACNNFIPMGSIAAAANDALLAGKFLLRVRAYTTTDWTGTALSHVERGPRLLTAATAQSAVVYTGVAQAGGGLGGAFVRLPASPKEFLRVLVFYPDALNPKTLQVEWDDGGEIAGLGVEVSTTNAFAKCGSLSCSDGFGSGTHIHEMFVVARTAELHAVWARYQLPPPPR